MKFYNIPEIIYNENGVVTSPKVVEKLASKPGKTRTFTYSIPTTLARINNTTNQSKMLWNPGILPDDMRTYEVLQYKDNAEYPGDKITVGYENGKVLQPSIRLKRMPELQEGGYVPLTNQQAKNIYQAKAGEEYIPYEYRNQLRKAKASLREQGLTGRNLRQSARNLVAGINKIEVPEIEVEPITIEEPALKLNNPAPIVEQIRQKPSFNELVERTLRGEYGNGLARRNALGEDYDAVQKEINRRLRPQNQKVTPVLYDPKGVLWSPKK